MHVHAFSPLEVSQDAATLNTPVIFVSPSVFPLLFFHSAPQDLEYLPSICRHRHLNTPKLCFFFFFHSAPRDLEYLPSIFDRKSLPSVRVLFDTWKILQISGCAMKKEKHSLGVLRWRCLQILGRYSKSLECVYCLYESWLLFQNAPNWGLLSDLAWSYLLCSSEVGPTEIWNKASIWCILQLQSTFMQTIAALKASFCDQDTWMRLINLKVPPP